MAGDRRNVALRKETGAENVTEIVVLGGTFCAPGAGLVAFRKNPFAGDRLEPEWDEARDPVADPGCVDGEEPVARYSAAATMRAAPSTNTHGRRRSGLPGRDSRTFMTSARSRRRQLAIRRHQRTGPTAATGVRSDGNSELVTRRPNLYFKPAPSRSWRKGERHEDPREPSGRLGS